HAECLLVKIRDKEINYDKKFADICLRSVDILKTLITSLKAGNYKKPDNYDDLLRLLMSPELKKGIIPAAYADKKIAAPKTEKIGPVAEPLKTALAAEEKPSFAAVGETKPPAAVPEAKKVAASISDEEESTVRVKIARIDKLIDMVGELVISHSMVAQDDAMVNGANHILAKKVMQSGKIIRELQDLSMTMRMIPFRATFQKMARVVRDISSKNGKQIDFITSGKETEVDRNLVDIINDALMHMVRNAVDHGIEPSEDRRKAGKPEKGTVILSAFHSGGNVVIEVKDDGKGLDRPKIVKKAIEKGLIKSDDTMSDSDVFSLVFLPGFSTADQITDISGRGVGMDVVKTSIESLRGRIDISSIPGNGCCFSIKVPLTLAVTDGMLIKVGSQRYIIPTANIYLTFRPKIEDIFTMAGRGEMVMLHGKMIPVFRLNKIFNISHSIENPWESLFVVIDDGDNKHCAILVDELLGQQQIVAKPLGAALGKIEGVSGGAILGDGKVGLIIDTKEIVNIARQTVNVKAKQIV
ncbi:MAG TPA: chemotaxis protein CheA, partial [Candidatus Wallbacteria bacterium]|nr:chemotaxis protein CheA [Candidatus Wallbacteria bacterium]